MATTIPCPHCGKRINPAAMLGAKGKGAPKTLTDGERAARRKRMAKARESRWPTQ